MSSEASPRRSTSNANGNLVGTPSLHVALPAPAGEPIEVPPPIGMPNGSAWPSRRVTPEATEVGGRYLGPASVQSFLHRARVRLDDARHLDGHSEEQIIGSDVPIFCFGDARVSAVNSVTIELPTEPLASALVSRYFEFAAPTYRILHKSTVLDWVEKVRVLEASREAVALGIPTAVKAIVYQVFAQVTLYKFNGAAASDQSAVSGEAYFCHARELLSRETGQPSLESVQARFLSVLYLLSTSRLNQAWFELGVVVQLLVALGLHRANRRQKSTLIHAECKKRVCWAVYTVDKYLSVMLGRPRLLPTDEIDQELPMAINDEDLLLDISRVPCSRKDCLMDAPRRHAMLAKIVDKISQGQYTIKKMPREDIIDTATALNLEISTWQSELPPFLSGAIYASSLIPVFRRQLTVLRLAHAHALLLVNRPLLLRDYSRGLDEARLPQYYTAIQTCIQSAINVVELVECFVEEDQFFSAFWFTHYIAFNAISILYYYLMQRKKGILPLLHLDAHGSATVPADTLSKQEAFFSRVVKGHQSLAAATLNNAPSLRYSIVLDELKEEVIRHIARPENPKQYSRGPRQDEALPAQQTLELQHPVSLEQEAPRDATNQSTITVGALFPTAADIVFDASAAGRNVYLPDNFDNSLDFLENEYDLGADFDFWPHLDSLPLSYAGLDTHEYT